MSSVHAVLLDLWDTTAWGEIPPEEERLTTQLGVAEAVLFDAFERTRRYRGTGGPSTTEESLAVVVDACGVELDREAVRGISDVHIAWLRRGRRLAACRSRPGTVLAGGAKRNDPSVATPVGSEQHITPRFRGSLHQVAFFRRWQPAR